ncbi:hypothetical protein FE257_007489 [Aspergillus nanangensis]|uniref:NmrA-like domain-containing protein n=1 Tax=Aspergillus nanangensis TaxID=2582783 RepID=A0AAD4GTB9_ASPNN|nr:hypothetical protein FE257_007489 [Aspergillus nanangensis]
MKTIAIVGATGNQGFSVAQTFLQLRDDWNVRCITRNPSSPTAQALASQGAELRQGDLDDVSFLRSAFTGAHVIFVNTDFWGPYRATGSSTEAFEAEVRHGRNAALAASATPTLERFIYSVLGPMKKHSHGKYSNSYHWDAKATVMENIQTEQPELATKASYIILGAYATNPLFSPKWNPPLQKYQFVVPLNKEYKLPIISARDSTGAFVKALVDEPPQTRLLAYDSCLSIAETVNIWQRVTGQEADLVEVTVQTMHDQFGVPWEVLDGPAFIQEFGYTAGIEGVITPDQLARRPQTESFEEWLRKSDWEAVVSGAKQEMASVSASTS